jgi:hypothetical protein
MYSFKHVRTNKASYWQICFFAATVLLLAGLVYRVAASRLKPIVENYISLPVSLKRFPFTINNWNGNDVPVIEAVQRVAGTDDFLNRLYIDKATGQWANVYVAYSARPRTMLGHRPQVCYVAGGWVHDSTELSQFVSYSGRKIPCLIHRFHKPAPQDDEIIVLNFYVVNSQVTTDERVFNGKAGADMADLILDFFPDENGKVRATQYVGSQSNTLK